MKPGGIDASTRASASAPDPELNGAGALFDFGCYGANLMTWVMEILEAARESAETGRTVLLETDGDSVSCEAVVRPEPREGRPFELMS